MDRFYSAERVEWATGPFHDGFQARIDGYSLKHCPSEDQIGAFAAKSWKAGWTDADEGIDGDGLADQMPVTR